MLNQLGSPQLGDGQFTFVTSSDSLNEGEMIEVSIGKETLVVGRVNGTVFAVEGICTHAYAELVDGELEDDCLYCPLHFACFDVWDGSVLEGPADEPLPVYSVIEREGSIWVKV